MQGLNQTSDKNLVARLEEMAGSERVNQVEILRCLAELDERRIVVELGYSGLWDFCRRRLKFSEATSTRRIHVARAAKKFPDLLAMLEDGRLNLATAAELAQVLTDANAGELLAVASGKTWREVQRLVDPGNARPAAKRDVIRRLGSVQAVPQPVPLDFVGSAIIATHAHGSSPSVGTAIDAAHAYGTSPRELTLGTETLSGAGLATDAPVAQVVAPAPALHRVSFTAEEQVVAKLERLQEILGGATLAEVCDRAADLLLDKVDRARRVKKREEKAAGKVASKKPAKTQIRKPEPRRAPVAMADQVIVEAGMQCGFESKEGVRCTETRFLTVDHIRPYALGGKSTDRKNLRCYCMAHNLLAGRRTFGAFHVQTERVCEK